MNPRIIFSLLLSATLFFAACRKPAREIKMHGTVYDVNTGERISGANIYFNIEFNDRFSGSGISKTGGSTSTDANGYYEIIVHDADRNKEVDKFYVGSIVSPQGATTFSVTPIFHGDFTHDFPLNGVGKLHLIFTNTTPFDAQDEISNFYYAVPGDIQNAPPFYDGMNVNDTFYTRPITGTRILHSSVRKNNITTQRTDTIYVPTMTEVYYHVNY